MLIETNSKLFKHYFPVDPHPFISEAFIELNRKKTDRILRLITEEDKKDLGFICGVKNNHLISPFSAPFGGFHYRKENIYVSKIDEFISCLKQYIIDKNYRGIDLTLPPEIYNESFNAKMINSLIRNGFLYKTPDITNWLDLVHFNGRFRERSSREYYRQAVRNNLQFQEVHEFDEKKQVFHLIVNNRKRLERPIYMSFEDVVATSKLWPTNFFKVTSHNGTLLASAIFYGYHKEIAYAVFWGDHESGRPVRTMDFMAYNIFNYYKNKGFRFIDLGISTEEGYPNEGLLRFKENHDSCSSLRFSFNWSNN